MKSWLKKLPTALVRIGKKNRWLKHPIVVLLSILVAGCEISDAVKTLISLKMRRRILASMLAFCMVFSMIPATAFAAEAVPVVSSVCTHHLEHTAECGYTEGLEGTPCTHAHSEDCYIAVTDCTHVHMADCYAADAENATDSDAKEPVNCTHVCGEETGCITKTEDCMHVQGTHDDTCGYAAGTEGTACGFVCDICNQAPEQKECVCPPVDSGEVTHREDCRLYEKPVAEQSEAVTAVLALIAALPTMDELSTVDTAGEGFFAYLETLKANVLAARTAYDALSAEEKLMFDATLLEKLTALEEALSAMPMAMAVENVAMIGNVGYPSLSEAVTSAVEGDDIRLVADDTVSKAITINKNLSIELDGYNLRNAYFDINGGTVSFSDRKGSGEIGRNLTYGDGIKISGATVTLNNIRVFSGDGTGKAIRLMAGDLTVNGGVYTGVGTNGSDAIFVTTGTLTINDGTFQSTNYGCGLSYSGTPQNLKIRKGTFIAGGGQGAFWLSAGGGINTQEKVETTFLQGSPGSYVIVAEGASFNKDNVVIGSELFISDGFQKPENGSTDPAHPATLTPNTGDSVTLEPQVLGGGGDTLTYEWKKDDNVITNASDPTYTIPSYTETDDGIYTVTIKEEGKDEPLNIYWAVGDTTSPPVTESKITITVNDGATEYGGDTLAAAVTASGVSATNITTLNIIAGEVTEGDWKALKSTLAKLQIFEIDAAVNVADIPNGDSTIFPASITNVTIPQAIKVSKLTFQYCRELTKVSIPNATSIGMYAFDNCVKLENVSLPEATSVGNRAFYNCTELTTADVSGADSIGEEAFQDCSSLTTVNMSGATSIGSHAFFQCENLLGVNLPEVTDIGMQAFQGCTSLAQASLPKATDIGRHAFSGCKKLLSVSLPEATSISESTFIHCASITELNLPNVNTIGKSAFSACTELTEVNLPKAISIGEFAFVDCKKLLSVNLPKATNIGLLGFNGCTLLTTVSLPNINTIGESAFSDCKALATLKLGAIPPSIVSGNCFNSNPRTNALVILDENGNALLGASFDAAVTKYKAHAGYNNEKGLWFGWMLPDAPITPVAVTGVSLNKSALSLEVGKSETLVATVVPENATNKAVTWKSSAEVVAAVDGDGEVTPLKEGTAAITVTTTDGSKTATCTVTVTAVVAKPAPGGKLEAPLAQDKVDDVFGEGNATLDEDGKTIHINNDITVNDSIIITATPVTIDLGSNTITGGNGANPVIKMDNGGTGSITGDGSISGGSGNTAVEVGDNTTVIIGGETTIQGGNSTNAPGGNGIIGGTGSNLTIGGQVTVLGGNGGADGNKGGDGIHSKGDVTVDGEVVGGNGAGGTATGGTGGDGTSTAPGVGNIVINNGGSSTGGTGGIGSGTGGNGGSGASGGTITIENGGSSTGGYGGTGTSGTGGSGGNGTTSTGKTDIDGTVTGGSGGSGATTGGTGGTGAASGSGSSAGDITIGSTGTASGGNGGTATGGSGVGGSGGNGTSTGGKTELETGGSATGGNGGSGAALGGNGGNGTTTGGTDTTINGATTGGNGGNGIGNGSGGNGGSGANQGSGTVLGNGTATGGDGGNGSGTGSGGAGGEGVGGGASAGGSLTNQAGASGRKATTEVDDSKAGTTVTVPDKSTLADAALTEDEKQDSAITEVKVVLNVEKKEDQPNKEQIDAVLNQPTVKADTIGAFFDITLEKIITNAGGVQPSVSVKDASEELEITITIPTQIRGGSNYVVIRVHNGTGVALATTQSGDQLTFKTDKFSTYAIAYTKQAETTPETPPSDGGTSNNSGNSGSNSTNAGGGGSNPPPAAGSVSDKPNTPVTAEQDLEATVDGAGTAMVNLSKDTLEAATKKAISEAKKAGVSEQGMTVAVRVSTKGKQANTMLVNLPKETQEYMIHNKIAQIRFLLENPAISMKMNLAAVTEINRQANADVCLTLIRPSSRKGMSNQAKAAIGTRPVFTLLATYQDGTKAVSNVGNGKIVVTIPYNLSKGERPGNLYVVCEGETGTLRYLLHSTYQENSKAMMFATSQFGTYAVGYKRIAFDDISGHFAKDDIEFVTNRGLVAGSDTTLFQPDAAVTCEMLVTALNRLAGSIGKVYSYHDIAPNQNLTRQEMVFILQDYAKTTNDTLPKIREAVTFADQSFIAGWAQEAVKSMQMAGIVNGKDGNMFDPTGIVTKAEISAVLHRYIERMIDEETGRFLSVNDSGNRIYPETGKMEAIVPDTKKYLSYIVVYGDTLWGLSRKYKCSVEELVELNGIKDPNKIAVGTELKIPQK